MNRLLKKLRYFATLSAPLISLAACGGGEGVSSSSPPPNSDAISDVFVGDQIDPNKWKFLHFVKKIENGQWISEIAHRGSEGGNDAFSIAPDGQLNSFQVNLTVTERRDAGADLDAFIQGRFFKDTTMTGRTGEIIADIEISRLENGDGLVAVAFVIRCLDADCNSVENLFFDTTSLGSATVGQTYQLAVDYNVTARTFTFRIDDRTLVFDNAPVFAANVESPRVIWGTWIDHIDENADPAEEGLIAARFDSLFIDGESFQEFDDTNDDLGNRTVRRVKNGVAELELARKGIYDGPFFALTLADSVQVTSSLKANVFNIEGSVLNGAGAQIVMQNGWYHTGTDNNGATGLVISDIRIDLNGEVLILAFRCENNDCSSSTELIEDNLKKSIFGTVSLSEPHVVELSWDGVNFIYGLDNRLEMFDPSAKAPNSGLTPGDMFPRIYVRLHSLIEAEDEAHIKANIDDVFVNGAMYDDFSPLADVSRGFVDPRDPTAGGDGGGSSGGSASSGGGSAGGGGGSAGNVGR